jgi:hypothetical protein
MGGKGIDHYRFAFSNKLTEHDPVWQRQSDGRAVEKYQERL